MSIFAGSMKRYVYDEETMNYVEKEVSRLHFYGSIVVRGVLALGLVVLFFWFYLDVLGWDLPKTAILKKRNAAWQAKMEILGRDMDRCEAMLEEIEDRNDEVYRSIYGMDPVSPEEKASGFGGSNRYDYLDEFGADESLKRSTKRLDSLLKRAYVQSLSLDEVEKVSRQAGDMPSCIPSVPPILPKPGSYRLSSRFGYRSDPVYRGRAFHEGVDFASDRGNPVYTTGDGIVEEVRYHYRGYGNEIIINHGYGYKTRYAHLKDTRVGIGERVCRGDRIGSVGSTGKSTGPHLHYEVIFRGNPINPLNFMDLEMPVGDYKTMVDKREKETALKPQSVAGLYERQKKQKADGRK